MTKATVEFVGQYVHKHLKTVREEIGVLRADPTMQAGIARGEIADVPTKGRSKDVA